MRTALIACFADVDRPGGAATLGRNLAQGLLARGHHVSMLSLSQGDRNGRNGPGDALPVRYFSVNAGRAWRVPQLVRGPQLRRVLSHEARPPDAVLALSPFFIRPARQLWPQVRIVYCFPCLLWRCLPHTWPRSPSLSTRLNHWLVGREERRALSDADAVMVQSRSVVQDVVSFQPGIEGKLVVAPTGVHDLRAEIEESRDAVRTRFATPDKAVVALAAGNLDRNKNFSQIIQAVHRADSDNLWLWIAGGGPLADELRAEAQAGPAAERIRFLGSQSHLAAVYGAADLFAHAAWYDNFPNVYLEAMVCGLPIVGPKSSFPRVVGPLENIIEEGVHGHTYSLDHPAELVGLLETFAAQPERCAAMGEAARQLALRKYDWSGYVDAVETAMVPSSAVSCLRGRE